MINRIRAAMFDDLEKVGVPEARQASEALSPANGDRNFIRADRPADSGVKLRDAYRKNALFDKSFSKAEKEQIDQDRQKSLKLSRRRAAPAVVGKDRNRAAPAPRSADFPAYRWRMKLGGLAGYVGSEKIRELLASPAERDFMEKVLADTYKMGTGKVVQSVGPVLSIFAREAHGAARRGAMKTKHEDQLKIDIERDSASSSAASRQKPEAEKTNCAPTLNWLCNFERSNQKSGTRSTGAAFQMVTINESTMTTDALKILGFAALTLSVRVLHLASRSSAAWRFAYAVLFPDLQRTGAACGYALLVFLRLCGRKKQNQASRPAGRGDSTKQLGAQRRSSKKAQTYE